MKSARKWIALGALVIVLLVAARLLPVTSWLKSFSAGAGNLGPLGFVVFVFVYALATILFLPGWPLTVGAGFTFGLFIGTAAVSLGSILGASIAFLIARFLARDAVESRTAKNARFRALDRANRRARLENDFSAATESGRAVQSEQLFLRHYGGEVLALLFRELDRHAARDSALRLSRHDWQGWRRGRVRRRRGQTRLAILEFSQPWPCRHAHRQHLGDATRAGSVEVNELVA